MNVSGFLYSQIGYDIGDPMRALIRSTDRKHVPDDSTFEVRGSQGGTATTTGKVCYWGEVWHSHWWEIDFSGIDEPGNYTVSVVGKDETLYESDPIEIDRNLLWQKTVEAVALDQMEQRVEQARNQIGWKDCGAEWREANSHATTIISLNELMSTGFQWLNAEQVNRLRDQIIHGCDYLAILQDTATRNGEPEGCLVHEIPNHLVVVPGDTAQAAVAFVQAGRLLADTHPELSDEYINRGCAAANYLIRDAAPYGAAGFSAMNHGADENFIVPPEFMTRDLCVMMWACLELWAAGRTEYQHHAVRYAREVMARQVQEECAEGGTDGDPLLHGHFYTFASAEFTEKANCHHGVGHDTGATFPHFIAPMVDMARRWPDHPDADLWRESVRQFMEGYLIPACGANPFYLLPVGYFKDAGLMGFCGPWHGINTSYGFAAGLASQCTGLVGKEHAAVVRNIVVGNLQWMCGLNAGITQKSFDGCVVWKDEVPEGEAVPYSQIYGVGRRWTGNWTGIRGTIPNGFDVNPQFQLVVKPSKDHDEPVLFTDEDWIPHGAGFLFGLTAHRGRIRFE